MSLCLLSKRKVSISRASVIPTFQGQVWWEAMSKVIFKANQFVLLYASQVYRPWVVMLTLSVSFFYLLSYVQVECSWINASKVLFSATAEFCRCWRDRWLATNMDWHHAFVTEATEPIGPTRDQGLYQKKVVALSLACQHQFQQVVLFPIDSHLTQGNFARCSHFPPFQKKRR